MKKKIVILTAVAALAVASIGSTLAYFNAQTGTLNNVMEASDGFYDDDTLLIDLFEEFGYGTTAIYNGGDVVPTISDVVPGQVITKEPYITNSSELDAYVAITITLNQAAEDDATIDWNTTDWTFVWSTDGLSAVAYYNGTLDAGATTENLFNTVTIKSALNDTTLPDGTKITIDLKGYAVQVDNNTATTAQAAILAQFGF